MKTIRIPPSKSVAHRALICAALAAGESTVGPIDRSDDIEATCRCMNALGAGMLFGKKTADRGTAGLEDEVTINGMTGFSGGAEKNAEIPLLDCGESGSTLRFLLPIALLGESPVRLTGSERLMERPMEPYLETLRQNGAELSISNGRFDAKGPIRPGTYMLPGDISSQFVTGLLLALPLLPGDSEIVLTSPLESRAYVALTIETMRTFGVTVEADRIGMTDETAGSGAKYVNERFRIRGGQAYKPCRYTVEADYSNAAFFLVAGALGGNVECFGLNPDSRQGDKEILRILRDCGANFVETKNGGIQVLPGELSGITVDAQQIPDLVPILSVLFCFCKGESQILNAGRLRHKESDRLGAITQELNRLGARIEEGKDYLKIKGVEELTGGDADAHNDHRIAMALAIASLKSRTPVTIHGAACVKKSYPGFWDDLGDTERVVKA